MPKKTVYKKGAKNFDSFEAGKNARLDPRFKHYAPDAEELLETAADIAAGEDDDWFRDATEREKERRDRVAAANRSVRAEGRMFEEMLSRACDAYAEAGRAKIVKVPEPRKVVGRTGGRKSLMICANDKKAHPDFMGSISPDGRCIVFDAKHTRKDKMQYHALTDNQKEILDAHEACGAACAVAVSFNFERFFMIPYAVWKRMKEDFGRLYITAEDEGIQRYELARDVVVDDKGEQEVTVWFLPETGD